MSPKRELRLLSRRALSTVPEEFRETRRVTRQRILPPMAPGPPLTQHSIPYVCDQSGPAHLGLLERQVPHAVEQSLTATKNHG